MPPTITLSSPLPASDLLFQSLSARQGISALDEFELALLSEKSDLAPEDLLGKPMGVKSYKPIHSSGEDFINDFLGMCGIPVEMTPNFPS